jgi:hypothetical protein
MKEHRMFCAGSFRAEAAMQERKVAKWFFF